MPEKEIRFDQNEEEILGNYSGSGAETTMERTLRLVILLVIFRVTPPRSTKLTNYNGFNIETWTGVNTGSKEGERYMLSERITEWVWLVQEIKKVPPV